MGEGVSDKTPFPIHLHKILDIDRNIAKDICKSHDILFVFIKFAHQNNFVTWSPTQ